VRTFVEYGGSLFPRRALLQLLKQLATSCVSLLLLCLFVPNAAAAPEAHLLRIDPRTAVQDGNPVLTAVFDISESNRIGDVTSSCASLRGDEQLDCMSDALERPHSLATPYKLNGDDVSFSVRVADTDHPAELLSFSKFGESQSEPGVGTAWLIIIDADKRMNKALDEATQLGAQFVKSMGPHDAINIIFLSDQQTLSDTKWLSKADTPIALKALNAHTKTIRSQGRTRPLLDLIKQSASDSFRALGNSSEKVKSPLHQAMVVISTGYGGGDPSTTGPGATKLSHFFTQGRFDDENTALPKLPTPIISIFVPPKAMAEHRQLARTFMRNLANPSIGGFFTILRDGKGERASRIVDTVRTRFSDMIIARFRLSCVAPTTSQSFSLLFRERDGIQVAGDATFNDVPVGFDPRNWPLDIETELTRKFAIQDGGVTPGGRVRIFGNFCWGGDLTRPEVYFLPPGENLPQDISREVDHAAQIQKRLTAIDMRGAATQANDQFAEFTVPDLDQVLHGVDERAVVRLVVVDSKLRRTSGLSAGTVITLKGAPRPILWKTIASGGGALAFLLILGAIFLRRGSKKAANASLSGVSPVTQSPYATPSQVSHIPRKEIGQWRALLECNGQRYTVLDSSELRCGRDGSRCAAVFASTQVSGLHATFRMEGSRLLGRDEGSTSGTRVNQETIPSGEWREIPDDAEISLGPETLRVTILKIS